MWRRVPLVTVWRYYRSVLQLLLTANTIHSSLVFSTLMMEALGSSETPVLTWAIWYHVSEDSIRYDHRRENLKSEVVSGVFILLRRKSRQNLKDYHITNLGDWRRPRHRSARAVCSSCSFQLYNFRVTFFISGNVTTFRAQTADISSCLYNICLSWSVTQYSLANLYQADRDRSCRLSCFS
jgi:hypothetical protein